MSALLKINQQNLHFLFSYNILIVLHNLGMKIWDLVMEKILNFAKDNWWEPCVDKYLTFTIPMGI